MRYLLALSVSLMLVVMSNSSYAQNNIPPQLDSLRTPRFYARPSERMLVVEVQGDPSLVAGRAFGTLFQLYFQTPGTAKGPGMAAPRARWLVSLDKPRSEWKGLYALPVPDSIAELPKQVVLPPGITAQLTTWEYGDVVEILHVGPYNTEEPTIKRLQEFAQSRGYDVGAEHEEEYVRGPTMSGPGDPANYLTLIRYRVTKR